MRICIRHEHHRKLLVAIASQLGTENPSVALDYVLNLTISADLLGKNMSTTMHDTFDQTQIKQNDSDRRAELLVNRDLYEIDNGDVVHEPYPDRKSTGCVYILRDPGNQALKVGYSSDMHGRFKSHTSSNPFLKPVKVFYMAQPSRCERDCHANLERYRVPNTKEWFYDDPFVIRRVAELAISGLY
jgi:hypothetical protein